MGKQIIIHIGLHKTGTSAIQSFIGLNIQKFNKMGIYIPSHNEYKIGDPNIHHYIASPFKKKDIATIEKIVTQIYDDSQMFSTILISSEIFSEHDVDIELVKRIFSKFFYTIKIVIYLKRQDELYLSVYNEMVKGGLKDKLVVTSLKHYRYDFMQLITSIEQLFGKNNLIISLCETKYLHNNSIFYDFMYKVFGIDNLTSWVLPQKRMNESYDIDILEFCRAINVILGLNNYSQLCTILNDYELKEQRTHKKSYKLLLSSNQRKNLIAPYIEGNKYISKKYFRNEQSFFEIDDIDYTLDESLPLELSEKEALSILKFIHNNYPNFYEDFKLKCSNISNVNDNSIMLITNLVSLKKQ